MKHSGIVLRSFVPAKMKIVLLDAQRGKIEVVPRLAKQHAYFIFSPGMYIEYILSDSPKGSLITEVVICQLPTYWSRYNLSFLHRVLLICYYFAPLELKDIGSDATFALLEQLYHYAPSLDTALQQKLFICRLFKTLGIYPEQLCNQDHKFYCLIFKIIDSNVELEETKEMYVALDSWIAYCLQEHPYAAQLTKKYYNYNLMHSKK